MQFDGKGGGSASDIVVCLMYLWTGNGAECMVGSTWQYLTNYCLHPGLQALLAFSSRREALTPIGAVEVLGDFDLAAGPHV